MATGHSCTIVYSRTTNANSVGRNPAASLARRIRLLSHENPKFKVIKALGYPPAYYAKEVLLDGISFTYFWR